VNSFFSIDQRSHQLKINFLVLGVKNLFSSFIDLSFWCKLFINQCHSSPCAEPLLT
jgi:hypothetical protein